MSTQIRKHRKAIKQQCFIACCSVRSLFLFSTTMPSGCLRLNRPGFTVSREYSLKENWAPNKTWRYTTILWIVLVNEGWVNSALDIRSCSLFGPANIATAMQNTQELWNCAYNSLLLFLPLNSFLKASNS